MQKPPPPRALSRSCPTPAPPSDPARFPRLCLWPEAPPPPPAGPRTLYSFPVPILPRVRETSLRPVPHRTPVFLQLRLLHPVPKPPPGPAQSPPSARPRP